MQTSATSSALQAEVNSAPNTGLKIPFALLGDYDPPSTSQFGIGVAGVSKTGYGVAAESFATGQPAIIALSGGGGDGIDVGITATSTPSDGIYIAAQSSGAIGIRADGGTNPGAYFTSQSNASLYGISHSSSEPGGYFDNDTSGNGLEAVSAGGSYAVLGYGQQLSSGAQGTGALGGSHGEGVIGYGNSGGNYAGVVSVANVSGTPLFKGYSYAGGNPTQAFIVQGFTNNRSEDAVLTQSSDVQVSGDLYVYGKIYDNCNAFPAVTSTECYNVPQGDTEGTGSVARTSGGQSVVMFGARASAPSVEDEGTAQLVNGRAYVRLDPAFARTMAMDRPYRVFVTPDGDSRGMYVSARSPQGFAVNENAGGRSSVAFEYRIVGAPFGDRSTRLAVVQPKVAVATKAEPGSSMKADVDRLHAQLATRTAMRARLQREQRARRKLPNSLLQAR